MTKREYRKRLKLIGWSLERLEYEHGLSATTWHNWGEIPGKWVYWLYWREAENRLDGVRKVLGGGDDQR